MQLKNIVILIKHNPHGPGSTGGVDVDDAVTDSQFPRIVGNAFFRISCACDEIHERIAVERCADLQLENALGDRVCWRDALKDCFQ